MRRAVLLTWLVAALIGLAPVAVGGATARAAGSAGPNLLLNPGAETGAFSVQGWDAVTIPGWRITSGLPTVVRYGTRGFADVPPGERPGSGRQLFAGGAGGTARLSQTISLRTPRGRLAPTGTRYTLSALLGGTPSSAAS